MNNDSKQSSARQDIASTYVDRQVEEALVGSALLNAGILSDDEFPEVVLTKPEDFSDYRHQLIWETILGLYVDQDAVDVLTVQSGLEKRGMFGEAGGPAYLTSLIERTPTYLHANTYAKIVRNLSGKRHAIRMLEVCAKRLDTLEVADASDYFRMVAEEANLSSLAFLGTTVADLISIREWQNIGWDDPEWLVPGLIVANGLNLISGDVASGKTWLSLDLAVGLATGSASWMGRQAAAPMPVIYFGIDNQDATVKKRMLRLADGRRLEELPDNLYPTRAVPIINREHGLLELRRLIKAVGAKLVVLDLWTRYAEGVDENKASDVGPIFAGLRKVADETECSFLLVHHNNKNQVESNGLAAKIQGWLGRIRGSVDIAGAVDVAYLVVSEGSPDNPTRVMAQVKTRELVNGERFGNQSFTLIDSQNGGLEIGWERVTGVSGQDTVARQMFEVLIEVLEADPLQVYSNKDLKKSLQQKDLFAHRSFHHTTVLLREDERVWHEGGGRGNPIKYQWKGGRE